MCIVQIHKEPKWKMWIIDNCSNITNLKEHAYLCCNLINKTGGIPPLWCCLSLRLYLLMMRVVQIHKELKRKMWKKWQLLWFNKYSMGMHTFFAVLSIKHVKTAFFMVPDSATVGTDGMVGADPWRSNAGEVKNLTNALISQINEEYALLLFSLMFKNYEPSSLINKLQFHLSW